MGTRVSEGTVYTLSTVCSSHVRACLQKKYVKGEPLKHVYRGISNALNRGDCREQMRDVGVGGGGGWGGE